MDYRNLTEDEIRLLKSNSCIADDWSKVFVKDGFNPKRIFQTRFSGEIRLGNFEKEFILPGGIKKKAGVRYSTLHNVTVGDNSCVENVENYIANYDIGSDTYIKNVGLILVDGVSSFGDGVVVKVLNETGGREVHIHSKLSSHLAYMATLYRYRPEFIKKLQGLATFYAEKHSSDRGQIGDHVTIMNAGTIQNVRIGHYAVIEGASKLSNGSINSNESAPVHIGSNVTCEDFIISSGANIDDGASISQCFVGQACTLTNNYSATNSLFFSNCYEGNGEACSIFAGPYTVTHHKSTLLIAGMFSFMNAGSGSNQSNHMYKLGPIHHGILERGSKTTSDSYILFPAHVGPFSLVMGRHVQHVDTSDLPFSYLIENDNTTYVIPGVNLKSVGTIRDAQKWPKRDERHDPELLDHINFNLLSPYTVDKMFNGIKILRQLQEVSGETSDIYTYKSAKIKNSSLRNGLKFYDIGINKFLGNSIIKRLEGIQFQSNEEIQRRLVPDSVIGMGGWVDMAGLITPKSEVRKLAVKVESGEFSRLQDINEHLAEMAANYYSYEWTWAYGMISEFYGIDPAKITAGDVIRIVEQWKSAVIGLDKLIYEDARKEFTLAFLTGFGPDGDLEAKRDDFREVRGDFEDNPFVVAVTKHIEDKTALGDELIRRLQPLR